MFEAMFSKIVTIVALICVMGFLIGMFVPNKVIPWKHTTGKSRELVIKIYLGGFLLTFFMQMFLHSHNYLVTLILLFGWVFAINSMRKVDLTKSIEKQTTALEEKFASSNERIEENNSSFFKRRKKYIIAGMIIVSVIGFTEYSDNEAKKEAEQRYYYSCEAIKNNDLNKALNYVEKYNSDSDKLLKKEIREFQDGGFFIEALRSLSDEEFSNIKNGTSEKLFFSNKELNKLMTEKIYNEPDKYSIVEKYDEEIAIKKVLEQKKAELAQRKKSIESQFSAWDGSHMELERILKHNLKDPDSYKHIESRYTDNGDDTITVYLKYRAKNSFGGYVVNVAVATVTVGGQILSVDW